MLYPMSFRRILTVLPGFILGFLLSQSGLTQDRPLVLEDQLSLAESLVEELEENYSQTDPVLAEPLAQLAAQYSAVGRYNDAHRILDRATQIVRINGGLYTRAQLPYVRQKIENYAASGDWGSTRQQMEHIFWLYRRKSRVADSQLIADLMHLSNMHLRGVAEDSSSTQSFHFRQAMNTNWMALRLGEALYGKEDERLIPLIYDLLRQYHLQLVAVNRGGSLGFQLRQVFPGSDWARDRAEIRSYFYFTGRRLLSQITAIHLAPENQDLEALAMARLYTADWQVLFNREAEALESYQQAYTALLDLQPEKVDQYFSQPRLLPIPHYHSSISAALAETDRKEQIEGSSSNLSHSFSFTEWDAAFPYARQPYQVPNYDSLKSTQALFSFNLSGVADIPLWVNSRSAPRFSTPMNMQLLDSKSAVGDEQALLMQRVGLLKFRPKLLDGLP
jgi:hypothetical protein